MLSISASRYSHCLKAQFPRVSKKLVSWLWLRVTYLGKWAWDWAQWFVCWFALCFSTSFGQKIELMFVDTAMPHMRTQEILQNYKLLPIIAWQTHKTLKKKIIWGVMLISCVKGTRTIAKFIFFFYLNRLTNRYCLLKSQALQNTQKLIQNICTPDCDSYSNDMDYFFDTR